MIIYHSNDHSNDLNDVVMRNSLSLQKATSLFPRGEQQRIHMLLHHRVRGRRGGPRQATAEDGSTLFESTNRTHPR